MVLDIEKYPEFVPWCIEGRVQDKNESEYPILIRIERSAGHGAGTPVSKIISQYADTYAFTLFNMGYQTLPNMLVKNNN